MARTIQVKIPTATLIANIKKSIEQIDEDVANYSANKIKYDEDLKRWESEVIDYAKTLLANSDNVGTTYDKPVRVQSTYRGVSVEINSNLANFPERPEEPSRPNQKEHFGREYATRKEILERNLRVLEMTTQEEVSASSYSSVMDLI